MHFLKLLYRGWMKFALVLRWVNTRIILSLVYFFVLTPLALIFNLLGKDPMNRRFGGQGSYWIRLFIQKEKL